MTYADWRSGDKVAEYGLAAATSSAPFSINLVRKLTVRRSLAGNPVAFAVAAFEPAALANLVDAVNARLAEDQLREESHSPRWEVLEAYRQKLHALRTRLDDT